MNKTRFKTIPTLLIDGQQLNSSKWGAKFMDDKDDDGDCLGVARQEGKAYCEATSIHGPAYLTEGHW